MTDLEIAHSARIKPIEQIAETLGLLSDEVISYGRAKAKVALSALGRLKPRPVARYILVTAINPTPLGEGKTTTSIGLAMGFCRKGHEAVVTLRQPSIGPVFGIKGGGTGGGRAQVVPMEDINLHLTGDAHAVATSHNLLSAFTNNHVFHGNELQLDSRSHRGTVRSGSRGREDSRPGSGLRLDPQEHPPQIGAGDALSAHQSHSHRQTGGRGRSHRDSSGNGNLKRTL